MRAQTSPSEDTVARLKERAAAGDFGKRRRFSASALVPALCAALIIGLCVFTVPALLPGSGGSVVTTVPASSTVPATQTELYPIKKWEELTPGERYTALAFGREYGTSCVYFTGEPGESLGTAELSGYDVYTDTAHTLLGEVFAMPGVLPDAAVAVSFEGSQGLIIYTNCEYRPATLGELISALDLRNGLSFGDGFREYSEDGKYTVEMLRMDFSGPVWKYLLCDGSPVNEGDAHYGPSLMSVSIDVAATGEKNISLAVNADGYLQTNILGYAKSFYIGADRVNAFISSVLAGAASEIIYRSEPAQTAETPQSGGEFTVTMVSQGYNPSDRQTPPQ